MANLLVASGLDPSGGAGFLADARVVEMHGLRPIGVITALTVQTSEGVREVEPVSAEIIESQLRALLSDTEVAAGVIGMLGDEAVAASLAGALELTAAPIVWDPVLRASAGAVSLYRGDPRGAFALLAPHLALLTPNLAEAEALAGFPVRDAESMRRAAAALGERVPCLVKGGHLVTGRALDVLAVRGATIDLEGERIPGGEDVHGTGGALAAAIACQLARGADLAAAARAAAEFVRLRLAHPVRSGRGKPSVM